MTSWFGETWNAPINDGPHVPTPVGSHCMDCRVRIEHGDRGVMIPHITADGTVPQPHHLACFTHAVGIPNGVASKAPHRPLTRGLVLDLREQHWSVEQIAEEYGREPEEVRALLRA